LARLFISYRRQDSDWPAGRIYDRLTDHFGRDQVFMDVDDIPYGVDFRDWLDRQIRSCDLVLAVIGQDWLDVRDAQQRRRLDNPNDFVRTEIELALEGGIPLIPVLLGGTPMPRAEELPASLRRLPRLHAATLSAPGPEFRSQLDRLIRGIEKQLGSAPSTLIQAPAPAVIPNPVPNQAPPQARPPQPPAAPPTQALLVQLADPATRPERRLAIGDGLAELGDPRPGVGLVNGLPDIDWVEIPAGDFLYGEDKETRHSDGFRIARYPITHAQFQAFLDDPKGYTQDGWWAGLTDPKRDPQPARWPIANHPRETVTWHEAMAFCAWLSDRLGLPIRLPTEWEWERAARGPDGREYPWGDGYRAGFANIDETVGEAGPTYLHQTTAVGLYPLGASPEGVMDLAGNVWEWCLNEYGKPGRRQPGGTGSRVVRGGSWINSRHYARASYRYDNDPHTRDVNLGFRVLCGPPIH
jgi:hypothetical protein